MLTKHVLTKLKAQNNKQTNTTREREKEKREI